MFAKINKVANALVACGVKQGDVVSISLPSTPEIVYLIYAISKIGAVADMIDPRSKPDQLLFFLQETHSKVFIFLDKCIPYVEKIIAETDVITAVFVSAVESIPFLRCISGNKKGASQIGISWRAFLNKGTSSNCQAVREASNLPVLITHTSGTTGKPKGVVLSNRNINAVVHQYDRGMLHNRSQRYLCLIPPFIAFGVCVAIHLPIGLGMADILIPLFDPKKFDKLLAKYRPEHFTCAPMSMAPLLESKKKLDLSFLITPAVGGDYIKPSFEIKINQFLEQKGCKHQLVKGYGMTEVSSSACTTSDYCNETGSVGIPLIDMTISIFRIGTDEELTYGEEGEICFSGPNVMMKYYNNPEATAQTVKRHKDGSVWVHSGDIGYMTEAGHLFVIDRLKRAIMIHDKLILPSKTERCLLDIPGIESAAVVPVRSKGTLKAFVIADESVTDDDILNKCRAWLEPEYIPEEIEFRKELPLTPVGKIDFLVLEELAEKMQSI